MPLNSVITGTGSYIPTVVKTNADFINERFLLAKKTNLLTPLTKSS